MSKFTLKAMTAACLLAAVTASYAVTVTEAVQKQPTNIFYRSGAEGWHWYKDPVEEEPQPEELLPPPEPPKAEAPAQEPEKQIAKGPEPFSLKWVKEMLPKYQERAWDNPTPENVQAFFLIQRFAMDRANKFADVAQQVVIGNTLLDESMRRPLATFASQKVDRDMASRTDDILKRISQHAGIFFFFKSDCQYCEAQAPILGFLEREYGFSILAVSIDGGELQSRKFENTRVDTGQAAKLGVMATPAIFLMNEEGQFTAIAQSVLAYSDLKQRILLVAAREGWITEQELKESQPFINPSEMRDLSDEFPKLLQAASDNPAKLFGSDEQTKRLSELSADEKQQLADENNFIEPSKLIALFGESAKTSGQLSEGELNHVEN